MHALPRRANEYDRRVSANENVRRGRCRGRDDVVRSSHSHACGPCAAPYPLHPSPSSNASAFGPSRNAESVGERVKMIVPLKCVQLSSTYSEPYPLNTMNAMFLNQRALLLSYLSI